MAKIRGIKPEFWTDEDIAELSIPARLLFIGLWNYACDNGHLQDKPKQIKMRILPGDDVNCSELLRELESKGTISRAEGWITIPNLTRHQKPDRRYFTTCEREDCSEPPETVSQRAARRAPAVHTPGTQGAHGGRTPGALGDGDGEVKVLDGDGESAPSRKAASRPLPPDWSPNDNATSFAADNGLDLEHEAAQFRNHAQANGRRQVDWHAAFRQWLGNAAKWRKAEPAPKPRNLPRAHELERPPNGLTPEEYAAWDRQRRERKAANR